MVGISLTGKSPSGKGCIVEVIDKKSPLPYYQQLAELLRREISERESQGEIHQLPSENELAEHHGITRATVRRALDVLERDGWIFRLWRNSAAKRAKAPLPPSAGLSTN